MLLYGMFGEIEVYDKYYNFKMLLFVSVSDDDIVYLFNYVVFDFDVQYGDVKLFIVVDIWVVCVKLMDGVVVYVQCVVVIKGFGL